MKRLVLLCVLFFSNYGWADSLDSCASSADGCRFRVKAVHSGKCLNVLNSSAGDGGTIIQFQCKNDSSTNQNWFLRPAGDGYYLLQSESSGKCLDVDNVSTVVGQGLNQWACHGGPNQQFKLIPQGNDGFHIVARHSGQCVDVPRSYQSDYVAIIQYPCHTSGNQIFRFELIP